MAGGTTTQGGSGATRGGAVGDDVAVSEEAAAAPATDAGSQTDAADEPDWASIEADLEAEVAANPSANSDPSAAANECGATRSAALGVMVATSDTNEFVGNANVELRLDSGAPAGGAPGANDGGSTNGGGADAGNNGAGPSARPPADHTKPTDADNGAVIWNPFRPAGDYFINVPILPEEYREKYLSPPLDEYTVSIAEGGRATKIVFIHPKPWIEIELIDSMGEPAKGYPYRLELPPEDGAPDDAEPVLLKEGRLDDNGFARITQDDVAPETVLAECHVSFPTQIAEEVAEAVLDRPDWLKIELLDNMGDPARFWRYEVFAPSNTTGEPDYSGALDAVGSAKVLVDDTEAEYEINFLPPLPEDPDADLPQSGNWVRIEALDSLGDPAAHWRYEIAVVGRSSRYRGTLDAVGQAHVPIFVGEECEITFTPPLA